MMTRDEIFEQGWQLLLNYIDGETLRAGISRPTTAELYREIATECRDRARQLDAEEEADNRADDAD